MLRIPSYKLNESVVGFNSPNSQMSFASFEEQMVCLIHDICKEALKYPEYLYLQINSFEIYDL